MEYLETPFTDALLDWIDGLTPTDWTPNESLELDFYEDELPF